MKGENRKTKTFSSLGAMLIIAIALSFLLKNLCPEACDSLPGHVLQGFASKL
jgi:hypothetical protein